MLRITRFQDKNELFSFEIALLFAFSVTLQAPDDKMLPGALTLVGPVSSAFGADLLSVA